MRYFNVIFPSDVISSIGPIISDADTIRMRQCPFNETGNNIYISICSLFLNEMSYILSGLLKVWTMNCLISLSIFNYNQQIHIQTCTNLCKQSCLWPCICCGSLDRMECSSEHQCMLAPETASVRDIINVQVSSFKMLSTFLITKISQKV